MTAPQQPYVEMLHGGAGKEQGGTITFVWGEPWFVFTSSEGIKHYICVQRITYVLLEETIDPFWTNLCRWTK